MNLRGSVMAVALLFAGASTSCDNRSDTGGGEARDVGTSISVATTPVPTATTTTGPPPPTGVFTVGEDGVDLLSEPGGDVVGRIRPGVALPYSRLDDGFAQVTTPCDRLPWVAADAGQLAGPFAVAIDPGHGGDEPGAAGPTGLTEKEVNLDVSRQAAEILNRQGIATALTRTDDYRATLGFRIQLADDAGAEVFVSVHHNAEPDEQRTTPGTEAYFQIQSAESKRLTGLVYEEVYGAFDRYDISFAADFDAGAKYRLTEAGGDYYGVIRRSFEAGVVGTLLESGFISNPDEEALLRRPDVRTVEAEAIARGVTRYFAGDQPGEVFIEPYPRTTPAGPGGGAAGCVDPSD